MTERISFTSTDHHHFEGVVYPSAEASDPLLVFFSALGTPAKVYRHFGSAMAQCGVCLCAPDWRGIDSSSVRAGRASDFGYYHLVEFDMACTIAALRQQFPQAPLWIGGHSLGGQLALLYAAAHPEQVAGVLLVASGSVHLPCYPPKMRLGVAGLALMSYATGPLLGYFPGKRVGFGGREAAALMYDWSHVAWTGHYRPRGTSFDYEQALGRLQRPVLALSFEADGWTPAASTRALLEKMPSGMSRHWHWSAADSAGVAIDHYSWLKQPALVAPALARHLRATSA
ncbi:MAG: alpha/beta hydrolase family protein [Rhodoferax sp.]